MQQYEAKPILRCEPPPDALLLGVGITPPLAQLLRRDGHHHRKSVSPISAAERAAARRNDGGTDSQVDDGEFRSLERWDCGVPLARSGCDLHRLGHAVWDPQNRDRRQPGRHCESSALAEEGRHCEWSSVGTSCFAQPVSSNDSIGRCRGKRPQRYGGGIDRSWRRCESQIASSAG